MTTTKITAHYMFGTVYFKVNIADDVALKEIIVDAIRSRLSQ